MSAVFPEHLSQLETDLKVLQRRKTLYTLIGIAITAFIALFGVDLANAANATPFSQGIGKIFDFPIDMFALSWELGFVRWFNRVLEFVPDLILTLNMALLSTFLAFIVSFVIAPFAAYNVMKSRTFVTVFRRILDLMRSFPEIVIAGFFLAIFSLGPIAAIIAVSVHTIGALGKMYFEVVENADMRPDEGLRASGANWVERVRFGIVPQVLPNFMSYFLLRFEINVRASTIIGAVGGGGIGESLRLSISQGHEAKTIAIISLLFVTIVLVDQFSAWLRGRLVGAQAFEFGRG